MHPADLVLAFGPLGFYLLLLGSIQRRRRPVILSGTVDTVLMAVGLVGFVAVGPMRLFMPSTGPISEIYLWLLALFGYWLCIVLWTQLSRPRLMIYNLSIDQARPLLAEVAARLDGEARWAGDSLALPQRGLQLHLEGSAASHHVALLAIGDRQSVTGWRQLHAEIGQALSTAQASPHPGRFSYIALGLTMIIWPAYLLITQIARHG